MTNTTHTGPRRAGRPRLMPVLLIVCIAGLAIWNASMASQIGKMQKDIRWLEARVIDASNRANEALEQGRR